MSVRKIFILVPVLALAAAGGCSSGTQSFSAAERDKDSPVRMPHSNVVELNDAVADASAGRFDDAARKLADVLGKFQASGDRVRAAESMLLLAICYEKTLRKEQAAVFYRRLMDQYPGTKAASMAAVRLGHLDIKKPPAE